MPLRILTVYRDEAIDHFEVSEGNRGFYSRKGNLMSICDVVYSTSKNKNFSLCVIKGLSGDLKDLIRLNLSTVCHGPAKTNTGSKIYSYKATLKEFIKRYKNKDNNTKTGMIGELLCHVTLYHFHKNLKPASPFFNMEEGSIKKGFDLIAIDKADKTFWITEVKSGEIGSSNKNKKIRNLIDLAKKDLSKRIPNNDCTIWYSAINNVELSIESGKPERTLLVDFLTEFLEAANDSIDKSSEARVILVPVLFENTSDMLTIKTIEDKGTQVEDDTDFLECKIFAIQKSTIKKVEDFLIHEAAVAK